MSVFASFDLWDDNDEPRSAAGGSRPDPDAPIAHVDLAVNNVDQADYLRLAIDCGPDSAEAILQRRHVIALRDTMTEWLER